MMRPMTKDPGDVYLPGPGPTASEAEDLLLNGTGKGAPAGLLSGPPLRQEKLPAYLMPGYVPPQFRQQQRWAPPVSRKRRRKK